MVTPKLKVVVSLNPNASEDAWPTDMARLSPTEAVSASGWETADAIASATEGVSVRVRAHTTVLAKDSDMVAESESALPTDIVWLSDMLSIVSVKALDIVIAWLSDTVGVSVRVISRILEIR